MKKSVPISSRTKRRKMKEELDYFNPVSNTSCNHDIPEKLFLESNLLNDMVPISKSNSHNCQDRVLFTSADILPAEINKSQNFDFFNYKTDYSPTNTSDTDDSNNF